MTGKLGVETDTYDSAGRIVTQSNWEVVQELADEDIIEAVMIDMIVRWPEIGTTEVYYINADVVSFDSIFKDGISIG